MVETLRHSLQLPAGQIYATLREAEKTEAELIPDVLTADKRVPQPGDSCLCGGYAVIYCSRCNGADSRVQYLRCSACRQTMGKRVVPEGTVRPQSPPGRGKERVPGLTD
jgi:hypothetical protein